MRATLLLGVKNEGAFLLEWLAHHRACGFTDFLVYSNDCSDGTDAMLDRLAAMGWLTHIRNDGPHPEGPQWSALKLADRHPLVRQAEWLIVLDIDEFINIHTGDRSIAALLAALPDATAIPLTWRLFGNAGVIEYSGHPVTETFTRAAPAILHWPWRAALFKTLFRNDGSYAKLGVHRPRSPDRTRLADQRWFDGAGRELSDSFNTNRVFSDFGRDNHTLVQLNHYALGAMEAYLVKCDRGRANRKGSTMDMGYWVDRNFNQTEDRSILKLDSIALRQALLEDSVLGPLHHGAILWRQACVRRLLAEESWRSLFGGLMMTPATRALDTAEAALVWRYIPGIAQPEAE